MMDSLIAQIVAKHGLVRENVATEVLTYILESSDPSVVRELVASYGLDSRSNSVGYRFELQRQVGDERGIPDVQVMDANENLCALIESKFNARLTPHQPTDYLRRLSNGGLLLFIAPKRRRKQLFDELMDRCRSSGCFRQMTVGDAGVTCAVVDERRLEVTSWDEILNRLAALQHNQQSSEEHKRKMSDIEQLGRFCDMADKETFEPLTDDQIQGTGISRVIRQLVWITATLIPRCIEKDIFQEMSESLRKGSKNTLHARNDDSFLSYGQDLRFCGAVVWMGFWTEMWEKRGTSPLWLWFERDLKASEVATLIRRVKGDNTIIRLSDGYWLIPIPIKSDLYQDDVVEEAIDFLSELKRIASESNQRE